jgi:hypothetical protein
VIVLPGARWRRGIMNRFFVGFGVSVGGMKWPKTWLKMPSCARQPEWNCSMTVLIFVLGYFG